MKKLIRITATAYFAIVKALIVKRAYQGHLFFLQNDPMPRGETCTFEEFKAFPYWIIKDSFKFYLQHISGPRKKSWRLQRITPRTVFLH